MSIIGAFFLAEAEVFLFLRSGVVFVLGAVEGSQEGKQIIRGFRVFSVSWDGRVAFSFVVVQALSKSGLSTLPILSVKQSC